MKSDTAGSPRKSFGIRASLITVMAALLFVSFFLTVYSIWTLDKTRNTMTRLVAEDLPDLVLAQRLADKILGGNHVR